MQNANKKAIEYGVFKNGYLGLSKKMIFNPQSLKTNFFPITLQNLKFESFQTTVQGVAERCLDIWHAKFWVYISFFCQTCSPETMSVDDIFFRIAI